MSDMTVGKAGASRLEKLPEPIESEENPVSSLGQNVLDKQYHAATIEIHAEQLDRKQIQEHPAYTKTAEQGKKTLLPSKSREQKFLTENLSFIDRFNALKKSKDPEAVDKQLAYVEKRLKETDDSELQALYSNQESQLQQLKKMLQ